MKLCYELIRISDTVKEKWEILGQNLGLTTEILKNIGQKYTNPRQRFYAMLNAWLTRKGTLTISHPVTVRTLVQVLESMEVGEGKLAAELAKRRGMNSPRSLNLAIARAVILFNT